MLNSRQIVLPTIRDVLERLLDQCTEHGGSPTVRIAITQIICVPKEALLRRGATM